MTFADTRRNDEKKQTFMKTLHRRQFLKASALTAASLCLPVRTWSRVIGANDDIRVAVVGFNGQGKGAIIGFSAGDLSDYLKKTFRDPASPKN